jgi:dihydrofolate reductase
MAHVIHSINIAAGGSCHHTDTVADEEHHRYATDLLTQASAVVLGRNTFDLFASFWPDVVNRTDLPPYVTDFASELDAKPKYVATSRAVETGWNNTRVLHGPGLGEVRQLVANTPGSIVVFGSPKLGASLIAAGLVQELHVVVQPFIGQAAVRAFEGLESRKQLTRLEVRPFQSGAVLLRYETAA